MSGGPASPEDLRRIEEFRAALIEGGTAIAELEVRSNPKFFLKMLTDERRALRRAEQRADAAEAALQVPAHDVIAVGDLLGFAGGAFGRDNYGPNECVHVFTLDGEPAAVFRTAPREFTAALIGAELESAIASDKPAEQGLIRR